MAKQKPKYYAAFPEREPGYKAKADTANKIAAVTQQPK
jgi:hypothetical protein